jgi:hypothetical protein
MCYISHIVKEAPHEVADSHRGKLPENHTTGGLFSLISHVTHFSSVTPPAASPVHDDIISSDDNNHPVNNHDNSFDLGYDEQKHP